MIVTFKFIFTLRFIFALYIFKAVFLEINFSIVVYKFRIISSSW